MVCSRAGLLPSPSVQETVKLACPAEEIWEVFVLSPNFIHYPCPASKVTSCVVYLWNEGKETSSKCYQCVTQHDFQFQAEFKGQTV